MSIKEKKVNNVSSSNILDKTALHEDKRADGKLKDSEEKYKSIVENINDVVFQLSPLGTIKYVSPKVKEIYGYDAADLVGKHLKKTTPAGELPKALKALKAVLSGRTVNNLEIKQLSADGRIVHMEMNVVPLRRDGRTVGVQGIMRDISERKRMGQELRLKDSVVASSVNAVAFSDLEGKVTYVNNAFLKMWGYEDEKDVLGKQILQIDEHATDIIDALKSKGGWVGERVFGRKDGAAFDAQLSASVIKDEGGKPIYMMASFIDITERKEAEKKLLESEQRYRNIFEYAAVSIWEEDFSEIKATIDKLKADGVKDFRQYIAKNPDFVPKTIGMVKLLDINQQTLRLFGAKSKEELTASLDKVFRTESLRVFAEELVAIAEGQPYFEAEATLQTLQGERLDVVITLAFNDSASSLNRVLVSITDVTKRKRAEDTLRESEERYRDLFENANDLIQSVAPDAHFIYVNRAWREALGYSEEEISKFTLWDIIHPECLPGCKEIFLKVMAGEAMENVEVVFVTKNGKLITVEGNINSWSKGGKVLATRAIFRNVTERKRMEQELAEKTMKLEQASQAKSEFLASMSHELRTPLNAVIGFSELMLDGVAGEINDEQKDYLTDILESGEHLLNLINDVLDLSKLEAGKMELRVENLNLHDVITEAFQTVKPMADDKKLELIANLQKGLPRVSADRTRLKQALLNLLSNSIKFSPAGGNITVEGSRKDEWCYVSVVDNGIGISEEDQKRIFQPFIQGKTSSEKAKEGTGLGLALSRKFIEACGGKIWVESEYGKWSRFTFTLPLAKESESHQEIQKPAEVIHRLREIPLKPGRKTILVVDDDRKSRSLMGIWLREEGYAVVQASSGAEGIRQAKELMPAAIILDILMPDKDGWQVLQELKSTPKTRNIPVIIASVVEEKELSFSLGAVDYFVKPVNKRRFLERIASLGIIMGKEVLVVDDNPADVRLVASILEAENIKVLRAYGGNEGLRIAREHKPALIVLDIVMPDICGFEVIERLREDEDTSHIPVIVFTVKDLTEDELKMLRRHVAAIVRKGAFKREDFLLEVGKAANVGQKRVRIPLKGKQ